MLKIVLVPANVLTQPTKPVLKIDDKIKKIVFDMEKILTAQTDPPGVGLAANQVGLDLSIFIIKPTQKAKIKVFINPKVITRTDLFKTNHKKVRPYKKRVKLEGCLSIPKIWGQVNRAERIFVHYQNLTGKKYLKWFAGFEAMIIQHEVDHLNGIVFTQRAVEQKRQLYREEDGELNKIKLT
ncbi:MAG: peptide deformylase [Candidatus Roizmanbacteria bacterium]|nr:peptide deformylase [Candidatus Roizmanbacteria bacterium]